MAALKKSFEPRDGLLIAAAATLYLGYLCLGHFSSPPDASVHAQKLAASRLAQQGMAAVKADKLARGIPIARTSDVNETGMIGLRYSGMTTTLGVLEAKRTSTHPDFAALTVDLMKQCGAQPGHRIAVNLSGSFPALAISVLSAARVLDLQPVVIASLGASIWGANDPAYTWLDIAQVVQEQTEIRTGMAAVSLGGADDVGQDMDEDIREHLRVRIMASGVPFIDEPDFARNIAQRMSLYLADGTPACFVNVGGNLASGGAKGNYGALRPGLIRSPDEARTRTGGLIGAFLELQVPVIHLLDLKTLSLAAGLPYDPVPLPEPGSSGIFHSTHYSRAYIAALLAVAASLLAAYVWFGRSQKHTYSIR
jgi:poly-gamma-glutamate system protein